MKGRLTLNSAVARKWFALPNPLCPLIWVRGRGKGEGGERWGGEGRTPSHFLNSILLGLGNQLLCKLLTGWLSVSTCFRPQGMVFANKTVLETQIQGVGGKPFGHTCSVFFHVGGRNFKAAGRRLNKLWVVPLQRGVLPHSVAGGSYGWPPSSKKYGSLNCKLKLQILGTLLLWVVSKYTFS